MWQRLEHNAVVNVVQTLAGFLKISPGIFALAEVRDTNLGFDLLVFEEAQENQSVQRTLYEFGQLSRT